MIYNIYVYIMSMEIFVAERSYSLPSSMTIHTRICQPVNTRQTYEVKYKQIRKYNVTATSYNYSDLHVQVSYVYERHMHYSLYEKCALLPIAKCIRARHTQRYTFIYVTYEREKDKTNAHR